MYGFAFILLGNVAANSISFGIRVLQAADRPVSNFVVRGIAIAVVTFACFMHGYWRQGGIYLSNLFAVVKVAMLLLIIVTGFISYSGVFNRPAAGPDNFDPHTTFRNPERGPFGFAESFLSILFAYGGFNQANYVMSEVENPRRQVNFLCHDPRDALSITTVQMASFLCCCGGLCPVHLCECCICGYLEKE